jgi:hypothetical protein
MAELLRHFAAGRITNLEFCAALPTISRDRSFNALANQAHFEFEFGRYRLGYPEPLSEEDRRTLARWAMFLYTDLDYQYDRHVGWSCLSGIGASGIAYLLVGLLVDCWIPQLLVALMAGIGTTRAVASLGSQGDEEVWPFFRREDYKKALKHPKLLCGKVSG